MSKVLRTVAKVATVVAAVAAVATTFGAALPAIAIGAGSISIASAASAVALVAGTVGSITAKKPKAVGTTNQFALDPQTGIPYAIGRTFIGGRLAHVEGYGGTTNPYRSSVIVFGGGGPYEQIESVLVDRTPVTFSGGAATGYYSGFMWFGSQLGATPEAAALSAPVGGFPNWTASHKLSGYCAGIWTVKFDTKGKVFASGTPEFGIVAKAAKVYDPRLDSTFPGGSGTCRALVESTYVWSENGILQGLTWALGRWQNGKRALGVGLPVADIDVQAFVDAANNADANGWKAGALIDASGDKWAVLQTMLQAGGAEPLDLGGLLSLRFDGPKVSLATLTADDLADGEIKVPAMKTWRDRINGVIPRYRSEAHNWEMIPASAVRGSTYETEDGEQRTREIEYYCVQNVTQAAQHAGYLIANSREIDGIELPFKLRAIGYRPGDCVTINIPEAGLTNQPVVITGRTLDPITTTVGLTCRTETAAKHAFALGRTATPPPSATISGSAAIDALVWNNRTSAGQLIFRHPEARPTEPPIGSIYIDATGRQSRFEGRALTIAGDPLTIAGDPVTVSGWVDVQDQAIGTAQTAADSAATAAAAANAELANIASDGILSPVEKPVVIRDAAVIVTEQSGLGAQATALGITTEKATYDAAVTALTSYLATLALPTRWDDVTGSTTIVGATFRQKFADVYTARTALLVKIDDANKVLANTAQSSANTAQSAADTANAKIAEIASDSILTPGEKPAIKLEYDTIIAEQTGLSAQAATFGITTERTAYNNAVAALTSYLATLTSPVLWSNVGGNTTIVAATFQSKFQDVYTTRTALLVKIDAVTLSQPIVSRLSPTTGAATTSFIGQNGLSFAQIAAVGEARDGDAVSFGATLPNVPKIVFLPGGNAASSGQNIGIQAIGVTTTGFTMKAKSQSFTPGATVTDTGSTAGSGGEPARVINRSSASAPYDGRFVFSVTVSVGTIPGSGGDPGYIQLGLFVKQSGAWNQVGTISRSVSGTVTLAVTPGAVDFGAGNEFGVSALAQEGTGTAFSFNSVQYTAGTAVETSLTPAGASPIPWLALL